MIFPPPVRVVRKQPLIQRHAINTQPLIRHPDLAKPTSLLQKISNYAGSTIRHAANGFEKVPLAVLQEREAHCKPCPFNVNNECTQCGCPTKPKLWGYKLDRASESCPVGKWKSWSSSSSLRRVLGSSSEQARPQIALPPVASNPGKVIRFDEHNLAPETGGERFNCSIAAYKDGYYFAYRNRWGGSRISLIKLTKDFLPVNQPKQLDLFYRGATEIGQEDPRLFWHKGKLHVWFVGWNGGRRRTWNKANVLFARINEQTLEVEDKFFPKIPRRNSWEKNHAYFDYNDETYCVYSIVPHRVHRVLCEDVIDTYETSTNVDWRYGHLRGGASPVLHNGNYYHFFHGVYEPRGKRVYSLGCAVFEAKPPFRITRITQEPIEVAKPNPNPHGPDCIFPGGAVFMDGRWCIAMGVNDAWCELRFYAASQIENALTSV